VGKPALVAQDAVHGKGDRDRPGGQAAAAPASTHRHGEQRHPENLHRDRAAQQGPVVEPGSHELEVDRLLGRQQFDDEDGARTVVPIGGHQAKAHGMSSSNSSSKPDTASAKRRR
jgi:hypothetical protein